MKNNKNLFSSSTMQESKDDRKNKELVIEDARIHQFNIMW
jgi:hypothetical protein